MCWDDNLWLLFILTLDRRKRRFSNKIKTNSLGMVSELLAIKTDIYNIKWIIIIKKGEIRQFTYNIIFNICTLNANPILNFILDIYFWITFKPNSNILTVLLNKRMKGHINFTLGISKCRRTFRLDMLHCEFFWIN